MVELEGEPTTAGRILNCLSKVLDPEVPVLSVVELGIIRRISVLDTAIRITITPTYSGCPALESIRTAIEEAVTDTGLTKPEIVTQLSPAWTTDWIPAEAREKLRAYGIAPPLAGAAQQGVVPFADLSDSIPCPHCDSLKTEELSSFGATACKALFRCLDCSEPFEYFKRF